MPMSRGFTVGYGRRMKNWVAPVAVIVALEYLVALLIGAMVGFHFSIPINVYPVVSATIVAATLTILLIVNLGLMFLRGEQHPGAALIALAKRHRRWIIEFSIGAMLVGLEIGVLNWMKVMLPLVQPFWADPMLANLDAAMFFGTDGWRVAHAMFGWAAVPISVSYGLWSLVKFGTILTVLCLPPSAFKSRAILAYFITIALGCTTQYILPSAGPIFFQLMGYGDRFADMPVDALVATARDYLWSDYLRAGGKIGGGISAMPSLHVAIALWIAMVAHRSRLRIAGWLFYASILVGSVMLGWHYASDSVAGTVMAWVAWWGAGLLIGANDRAPSPSVQRVPCRE